MLVEVCANSLESALNAEKAGADRIELCSELAVGGITPSYGLLKAVSEKISIPVRVLIRPRSGDFSYSNEELEIMKRNIELCAKMGFQGIVSGVLNNDFSLNFDKTRQLIEVSKELKFTFNRAFDLISNPIKSLSELENLEIETILTSGQQETAMEGIDLLTKLHKKATSSMIMPGSGINTSNAYLFKEKGFKIIHLSGVKMNQKLQNVPKVGMNSPKMLSDDSLPISNLEIIQAVIKAVK